MKMDIFITFLCIVIVSAFCPITYSVGLKDDLNLQYDPVWIASVQQYEDPNKRLVASITAPKISDENVQFQLYTRKNPREYQMLYINDSVSLRSSNFDFNKKVKVLAHGWLNNGSSPMPTEIRQAYLIVSDLNIIVVDWGVAADVNYIWASYNVAKVGSIVTQFLDFLISEGVSMNDVHLIGHSLGAHVMGIAGEYVSNGTIDTITGLDPALPLYQLTAATSRLDVRDARRVEVIHTCGGYLGFASPLGHVDFYPNGGSSQPGCGSDYRGFCAHNRAHLFFAESITSKIPFTSVQCESYDELRSTGSCKGIGETMPMGGFEIHYGKEGIFYLKTRDESPFALGDSLQIP